MRSFAFETTPKTGTQNGNRFRYPKQEPIATRMRSYAPSTRPQPRGQVVTQWSMKVPTERPMRQHQAGKLGTGSLRH